MRSRRRKYQYGKRMNRLINKSLNEECTGESTVELKVRRIEEKAHDR